MPKYLTEAQVIERLRKRCLPHGSQTTLAAQVGVSASFVNAVLRGRVPPSPRLLKELGLKRAQVYTNA